MTDRAPVPSGEVETPARYLPIPESAYGDDLGPDDGYYCGDCTTHPFVAREDIAEHDRFHAGEVETPCGAVSDDSVVVGFVPREGYDGLTCACGSAWWLLVPYDDDDERGSGAMTLSTDGEVTGYSGRFVCASCSLTPTGNGAMSDERIDATLTRADGAVETVTAAVYTNEGRFGLRDFRTADDAPVVLHPGDSLNLPIVEIDDVARWEGPPP